ncbi:MAG: hypothetical protein JWM10_3932 [Myxococcaceae bacterium]|nr:hypothetical protein [Myxococcaceae bacterium]
MLAPAPLTATAPSRRHWPCEVCSQWQLPRRPHGGWRAVEVFAWAFFALGIAASSKMIGVVGLPFMCLLAGCVVGPLRALAAADARCPGCNRYIFPPKR